VVQYCSLELPEALSGESEVLTRLSAVRIDSERLFEMPARAVQIVDPSKRRSERDMILGAPARDHSRTIEQAACFVHQAKPSAHHRQAAQGAKVAGLIGQQAAIDLLRRLQDLFSGWRDWWSGGSADRDGLFVHERNLPMRCPRSLHAGRMFQFQKMMT
jgi:hypothetical protein